MSFQPDTLTDLSLYWTRQGGRPLGIVGDMRHCSGYHLGKDRIYGKCACKPDGTCEPGQGALDYSVQHPRDRAGLSDAASALDLGALNGSLSNLYAFSRWLVARATGGAPGTRDIREIIYSPDGRKVQRWSGIDNLIHTGPGNGDSSHIGHTHISFFRDSEARDKRPIFAPYFEKALPDTSEAEVATGRPFDISEVQGTFTVKGAGHDFINLADDRPETRVQNVPDGLVKNVVGKVILDAPLDSHEGDRRTGYLVRHVGPDGQARAYFALEADGSFDPLTLAPDVTPYSQADIDKAVAADRAGAKIVWPS